MKPQTPGNLVTGAAALLFFGLCMLLPLVGRAARLTDHYGKNVATFSAFLALALALAWQGRRLKLLEHMQGRGRYPWLACGLFYVLCALAVLLALGRLHK